MYLNHQGIYYGEMLEVKLLLTSVPLPLLFPLPTSLFTSGTVHSISSQMSSYQKNDHLKSHHPITLNLLTLVYLEHVPFPEIYITLLYVAFISCFYLPPKCKLHEGKDTSCSLLCSQDLEQKPAE